MFGIVVITASVSIRITSMRVSLLVHVGLCYCYYYHYCYHYCDYYYDYYEYQYCFGSTYP